MALSEMINLQARSAPRDVPVEPEFVGASTSAWTSISHPSNSRFWLSVRSRRVMKNPPCLWTTCTPHSYRSTARSNTFAIFWQITATTAFRNCCEDAPDVPTIVARFMAVLELMRSGTVVASQKEALDTILVALRRAAVTSNVRNRQLAAIEALLLAGRPTDSLGKYCPRNRRSSLSGPRVTHCLRGRVFRSRWRAFPRIRAAGDRRWLPGYTRIPSTLDVVTEFVVADLGIAAFHTGFGDPRYHRVPPARHAGQIAAIRGVNVDLVVRTLLTRGLIAETGHVSVSGATMYGTTQYFSGEHGYQLSDQLGASGTVCAGG